VIVRPVFTALIASFTLPVIASAASLFNVTFTDTSTLTGATGNTLDIGYTDPSSNGPVNPGDALITVLFPEAGFTVAATGTNASCASLNVNVLLNSSNVNSFFLCDVTAGGTDNQIVVRDKSSAGLGVSSNAHLDISISNVTNSATAGTYRLTSLTDNGDGNTAAGALPAITLTSPAPEPSSLILVAGGIGLAAARLRRRR
jgi:hypothetical protein